MIEEDKDDVSIKDLVEAVSEETEEFIYDTIFPLLELRSNYLYAEHGVDVACFISTDPWYRMLEALLILMGSTHDEENFRKTIEEILTIVFDAKKKKEKKE